jgi:hypothetical protein
MKNTQTDVDNIIGRFDRSADHFGFCPECFRSDHYLNLGADHWMVCERHRYKWNFGANLFGLWRKETEVDWERNAGVLAGYVEVEPVYLTPPALPRSVETALDQVLEHFWRDEARDYAGTTTNRDTHVFRQMRVLDAWMSGLAEPTREEC